MKRTLAVLLGLLLMATFVVAQEKPRVSNDEKGEISKFVSYEHLQTNNKIAELSTKIDNLKTPDTLSEPQKEEL